MKLFKVIASRTTYEYIEVEAENSSDAIQKANNDFTDWKELPEFYWEIDEVLEQNYA